jgi:hypothetical protein
MVQLPVVQRRSPKQLRNSNAFTYRHERIGRGFKYWHKRASNILNNFESFRASWKCMSWCYWEEEITEALAQTRIWWCPGSKAVLLVSNSIIATLSLAENPFLLLHASLILPNIILGYFLCVIKIKRSITLIAIRQVCLRNSSKVILWDSSTLE